MRLYPAFPQVVQKVEGTGRFIVVCGIHEDLPTVNCHPCHKSRWLSGKGLPIPGTLTGLVLETAYGGGLCVVDVENGK